ncbi:MAG: LysR family transcriptional regulator, partial [Emcibacteraceae bacterium]|nr:LysR family transcriptional regulator [Emcibacteraceae bacterium]
FRAAAESLNLSPSVVSYQISNLEERLGSALLYRSTRKLSLTAEGEILYKHALSMIDQAELGIRNVSGHDVATGRLSITLPLSMTSDYITKQFADFSLANPEIDMHVQYTDTRMDLIADGIDIAFRMGSLPDSSLNAKKITEKQRTLVCSPEYYATRDEPKKPEDLNDWNWIKHDMLPNRRTLIKDGNRSFQLDLKGNIKANSAEAMVKFTLYGLGISTAAQWLIKDELADGRLIHILPDWKVEPMPLYAVWHGNITDCSNTRRLLNFISDH